MSADLVLFDDARARRWSPFAETRPVSELRYGSRLLRERVESLVGVPTRAALGHARLRGWDEPGAPPVVEGDRVDPGRRRLYWSSRAVPTADGPFLEAGPATFRIDGRVVGWRLEAGDAAPPDTALLEPEGWALGEAREVEGEVLEWPWHLVEGNARRLSADLSAAWGDGGPAPAGVVRIGHHSLSLGSGAEIEPGVVVDTRDGPVRLDEGVRVEGPARLVGPLHLGPGCTVFGGSLTRVSAGPVCKLRGEVDTCVILGFVNKAHDGYLGHALVGRWVNLGALTTNSDLKNSYSPVRVELPHGTEETGLLKVGVFLGDHVKTGIGTLLTTGGVVGAGSNLFGGGGTPPRHVPAFSWGGAEGLEPYRFDKFAEVASTAMARRGQSLTPGVRAALERAWREVHGAT